MDYKVYYRLREEEDLDFKADIFTAGDKPVDSTELSFSSVNDEEARKHVESYILPKDTRKMRGVGKIKNCRPKGKVGSGAKSAPVLLDLNFIQDPLKTKLYEALSPLVVTGDLSDNELKLSVNDRSLIVKKPRKKKETVHVSEEAPATIPVPSVEETVVQPESKTA
jgi:hypothetical protein